MQNNIEKCSDCRYFMTDPHIMAQNVTSQAGVCRRFPPTPQIIMSRGSQPIMQTVQVPVQGESWCGEWCARLTL